MLPQTQKHQEACDIQALKTASLQPNQQAPSLLTTTQGLLHSHAADAPETAGQAAVQDTEAQSQLEGSLHRTVPHDQQQQQLSVLETDVSTDNAGVSWQSPQQSVRTHILGLDQLSAAKQGRPEGLFGIEPVQPGGDEEAALDAESVSTDIEAESMQQSIEVSQIASCTA